MQNSRIYRMQTIIKDGILNVPKIHVRLNNLHGLSEDALAMLNEYHTTKDYYIVDLTKLPITNRQTSTMGIDEILRLTKDLVELKAKQKALRSIEIPNKSTSMVNTFNPFLTNTFVTYTPEQLQVLKEHGLNNKLDYVGIENKTVLNENGDFYEARSIEFAIKGCSSIPKVMDSIKKKQEGKKLNIMDEAIIDTLERYSFNPCEMLINSALEANKRQITTISSLLFAAKVSKVLTGGWWTGLTATAKAEEYEENGIVLQVKTKREKVYL